MRIVAITVDTEFPDQPAVDPIGALDEMLMSLASHRAEATFFLTGNWAQANPERALEIKRRGHLIGNHSYSHCSLTRLTDDGIVEDLQTCDATLMNLGIESRPWFRAPYGNLGPEPSRVLNAVKTAGYKHVHWHANGEDWRPARGPHQIARAAIDDVHRRWPRPAIVLFHSWPDPAPRALALVLERLSAEGATFTRLDRVRFRDAALGRLRGAIPVGSRRQSGSP